MPVKYGPQYRQQRAAARIPGPPFSGPTMFQDMARWQGQFQQQQLSQVTGQQQSIVEMLKAQGVPENIAQVYGGRLNRAQAEVAGLQFQGSEEARKKALEAQKMAEQMIQTRYGIKSPLLGQAAGAVSQTFDRPLVDQYLQVQLMDKQRALIEAQREQAIERSKERYAKQGTAGGPGEKDIGRINKFYDAQTRSAQQTLGIQAALRGQEQRNVAVGQAQGIAGQQLGRGDRLAGQLAGQYLGRQYERPDYSALLAMGGGGLPTMLPPRFEGGAAPGQSIFERAVRRNTGAGTQRRRGQQRMNTRRRQQGLGYPGQPNRMGRQRAQGEMPTRQYRFTNPYTGAINPAGPGRYSAASTAPATGTFAGGPRIAQDPRYQAARRRGVASTGAYGGFV